MTSLVWPLASRSGVSITAWIGRICHWALVLVAVVLVGAGIMISGLQLGQSEPSSLLRGDALVVALQASALGISVFFLGRTVRYLLARE